MLTIPKPTFASGRGKNEYIELGDIPSEDVERKGIDVLPDTEDTGNVYHDGATPITRYLVLTSIILALLSGSLDPLSTISTKIIDEFDSLSDLGWYASAYTMTNLIILPLSGMLYANFSSRWTMVAMLVFQQAGVLICGFAPSSVVFICGRVVSGIGGGGMPVGALVIIDGLVPLQQRPLYTASTIGVSNIGLFIGPVIGGLITEKMSWRWTFYYRAPGIFIATIALMLIQVPDQVAKPKFTVGLRKAYHMLDTLGLFFIITFVVTLLSALQIGHRGWTMPRVVLLFVAALLSGTSFVVWSVSRKERALFPTTILKNRHVYYANLFGMANSGGMIPTSYFLPIFMQSVLGASPLQGALWLLPKTPIFIVVLVLASILIKRAGLLPLVLAGSVLSTLSPALLSTMSPSTKPAVLIAFECIGSVGRGLIVQAPTTCIQFTLPGDQVSYGHAVLIFTQTLSMTIVSVLANVVFRQVLKKGVESSATVSKYESILVDGGATKFRGAVSAIDLPEVLKLYSRSIDSTFYLAIGLGALGLIVCFGMKGVKIRSPDTENAN